MNDHHEWMKGHKVFGEIFNKYGTVRFITDQNEIMELLNEKGWINITIFDYTKKDFDKYVKFHEKEK